MNCKTVLFLNIIILIGWSSYAQTILKGTVKDSIQNPIVYANIIAEPANKQLQLKFSISDAKGRYLLKLKPNESYSVKVSYMGYKSYSFKFEAVKNSLKEIILKEQSNNLEEIIIELPVSIKEDTITYNTSKFINGKERKLKNILKKLPGIEISKDAEITVLGKKIDKLLVDGKPFFGGGTKLAIENIPANAVGNIQVLENYNEIAFLKNVSESNQTALNILLKKDKKKFLFGDIEAGKGNNKYYRAHGNLFYYSPKTNINLITNTNNTGEKVFTFKDYMNFQGGINAALKGDGTFFGSSMNDFTQFMDIQDYTASKNRFSAINIRQSITNKTEVSGYGIFSNTHTKSTTKTLNQYTQFDELNSNNSSQKNGLSIVKITFDYEPSAHSKSLLKTQIKKSDHSNNNSINSTITDDSTIILSKQNTKTSHILQSLEWHTQLSYKHTFSFAVNIALNKNTPYTTWFTNKQLLQGLIPLKPQDNYTFIQKKENSIHTIDFIAKHYWILDKSNHIYTTLGSHLLDEEFNTNDFQKLKDGSSKNFDVNGFNNQLNYNLQDVFLGLDYKFKIGKFTAKQGAFLHQYNWNINTGL